MDKYKLEINRYLSELNTVDRSIEGARRPNPMLLIHFTSKKSALQIVRDKCIKLNENRYISFTELHPFEFNRIASYKRPFGFAFFKDDIVNKYSFYNPLALSGRHPKILKIESLLKSDPAVEKLLLLEAGSITKAIHLLDYAEVRTVERINLSECVLFFRNRERDIDRQAARRLEQQAIFRLPYAPNWIFQYFINAQRWHYKEYKNFIEFKDTAGLGITTDDLMKRLNDISPPIA